MKRFLIVILIILLLVVAIIVANRQPENKGISVPYKIVYNNEYEDHECKDPYYLDYDEELINAYIAKIDELEKDKKAKIIAEYEDDKSFDYSKLKNTKYELIFLNDDNIPELVASEEDEWVELYTFVDGKVKAIEIDSNDSHRLVIGKDGNQAYEYIPKTGIVHNLSSDYVGLIYKYNYKLLSSKMKLEDVYSEEMIEIHFEDINSNFIPDDDERYSQDISYYFFGKKQLSEEKFIDYMIEDDYENLVGTKNAEDMKYELEDLIK